MTTHGLSRRTFAQNCHIPGTKRMFHGLCSLRGTGGVYVHGPENMQPPISTAFAKLLR